MEGLYPSTESFGNLILWVGVKCCSERNPTVHICVFKAEQTSSFAE